jgi:hypothetical protein
MNTYFAFHNPTKVQHQDLTTEELKKKLLEDTNLANWLVWKPGMNEWKSAAEVSEIQDLLKQAKTPPPLPVPPPLPPEKKLTPAQQKEEEFVVVDYAEEKTPEPTPKIPSAPPAGSNKETSRDRSSAKPAAKAATPGHDNKRKFPRIKGRLRTIITNRDRAFITYTRDISLGGVLLEHAIPEDLLKGSVDIFITGPSGKDSIVFRCQPVPGQSGQYRFTFVGTDSTNQEKLTAWLDHLGK